MDSGGGTTTTTSALSTQPAADNSARAASIIAGVHAPVSPVGLQGGSAIVASNHGAARSDTSDLEESLLIKDGGGTNDSLPSDFDELEIQVRNLSVAIGSKQILNGINCNFRPRSLCALVGPSGAGKTTLLNTMAGFARGDITGQVLINGALPTDDFKLQLNFVPQDDILYPSPTVFQTLLYAARLRLPGHLSYEYKVQRVMDVIRELSLTDCKDTHAGNQENRGISGGQRKRLSIGLELLTNPSVLFVDEPTSGLSAADAELCVRALKLIAKKFGGESEIIIIELSAAWHTAKT